MRKLLPLTLTMLAAATLSACGGGGGGGAFLLPSSQPTAVLTLSTAGTGTVYGIDVTVNLPEGVTAKSTMPPQTDAGVATASGAAAGSTVAAVYSAASGTVPGKIRLLAAKATGFGVGEFATVKCDIASGHTPMQADFSLSDFSASDENGVAVPGLTAGFTADIH